MKTRSIWKVIGGIAVIAVVILAIWFGAQLWMNRNLALIGGDSISDTGGTVASSSSPAEETSGQREGVAGGVSAANSGNNNSVESQVFDVTLADGVYVCGIDFPAGRYSLTATERGGNVTAASPGSSYNDVLNEILGVEGYGGTVSDIYKPSYNGVEFESGTVLELSGVSVALHSDSASTVPLSTFSEVFTQINQGNLEIVHLTPGRWIVGQDFPVGLYTVVATDGAGNVQTDSGILNLIMCTADNSAESYYPDMYIQEFKNAPLTTEGDVIESDCSLDLVPSK